MKVKLLKNIRKRFYIIPNIDKRYGFYVISKYNGCVIGNQAYDSGYVMGIVLSVTLGFIRAYFVRRIHEQHQYERKSTTIIKRLAKSNK